MNKTAWIVLGAIVVALLAIGGPLLAIASDPSEPEQRVPPLDAASASVQHVMDRYVGADGRFQGPDGTTPAQQQARALLLAAANSDRSRFDAMWTWTQSHLQSNGVLAAQWSGDKATGRAGTGTMIDMARALALASGRFGTTAYRTEAERIVSFVSATRVLRLPDGTAVLTDSDVTAGQQHVVNPSSHVPRAESVFRELTNDAVWTAIAAGERGVFDQIGEEVGVPALPFEPVFMTNGGELRRPAKQEFTGLAATVPLHLAESCDSADRAQAAKMWRVLNRSRDIRVASTLSRTGKILDGNPSATTAVASAAGANAAEDRLQALLMLDRADEIEARLPSPDNALAAAMGRVALTTPWLGRC